MESSPKYWTTYHGVVGAVLRQVRKSEGCSQVAAADSVGLSQSALSKVEKGRISVNVGHIRKLCDCYGYRPYLIIKAADQEVERLEDRGVTVFSKVAPSVPAEADTTWSRLASEILLSSESWLFLQNGD